MADLNRLPPLFFSLDRTKSQTADTLAMTGPTWEAVSFPCLTRTDFRSRGGDASELLRIVLAVTLLSFSEFLRGRPTLPLDLDPLGRPRGMDGRA